MRFTTIILSFLAGTVCLVSALPSVLTEEDLYVRHEGDVNALVGRDVSAEDIRARDVAYARAMGLDPLDTRDHMSEEEILDLAMRSFGVDKRDMDLAEVQPRAPVAAIVRGVVQGVIKIVELIKGQIEHDKVRRGEFTKAFIDESMKKYPQWNWVICHTAHKTKFNGQRGKDWFHRHQEFDVAFRKTIGYEIYWFKSGTFERHGDGGYLNWAFGGRVKSRSSDGKTVVFS